MNKLGLRKLMPKHVIPQQARKKDTLRLINLLLPPRLLPPPSLCKINSVTGRVCLLRTKIKILNFKESFLLYLSFSEGFKLV